MSDVNIPESLPFNYILLHAFFIYSEFTVKTANMARENGENHEDGADEKMLGAEDKAQLARKDEVKFISGDHTNGDAKIDIGNIEKVCTLSTFHVYSNPGNQCRVQPNFLLEYTQQCNTTGVYRQLGKTSRRITHLVYWQLAPFLLSTNRYGHDTIMQLRPQVIVDNGWSFVVHSVGSYLRTKSHIWFRSVGNFRRIFQ